MPRGRGGRGLQSLEVTYKEIKITAAVKLLNDIDDGRMKLVRQFHFNRMTTASYSLFKTAKGYANELDLKLEISACDFKVSYEEPDGNKDTKDLKVISHEIVKRRNSQYQMEISNST